MRKFHYILVMAAALTVALQPWGEFNKIAHADSQTEEAVLAFSARNPISPSTLRAYARSYLRVYSGDNKREDETMKGILRLNYFEFRGLAYGSLLSHSADEIFKCLSWQSQLDFAAKSASLIVRAKVGNEERPALMLASAVVVACNKEVW